jgi:hypothetical protein
MNLENIVLREENKFKIRTKDFNYNKETFGIYEIKNKSPILNRKIEMIPEVDEDKMKTEYESSCGTNRFMNLKKSTNSFKFFQPNDSDKNKYIILPIINENKLKNKYKENKDVNNTEHISKNELNNLFNKVYEIRKDPNINQKLTNIHQIINNIRGVTIKKKKNMFSAPQLKDKQLKTLNKNTPLIIKKQTKNYNFQFKFSNKNFQIKTKTPSFLQ